MREKEKEKKRERDRETVTDKGGATYCDHYGTDVTDYNSPNSLFQWVRPALGKGTCLNLIMLSD